MLGFGEGSGQGCGLDGVAPQEKAGSFCTYSWSFLLTAKLEEAGTVDFKKRPARRVGTRSRQCRAKVPGRFAFPGARNPRICSTLGLRKYFPASFRDFPGFFLGRPRTEPGKSHSLLEFSYFCLQLSFLAYSPLRRLLEANCKEES